MSKLLILFAMCAVAAATATQMAADRMPNKYANGALKHAKALTVQVRGEMKRAAVRHMSFVAHCKRFLHKHSHTVTTNMGNIERRSKTIAQQKKVIHNNHLEINMATHLIKKLSKTIHAVHKQSVTADAHREGERRMASHTISKLAREIAFVRSVYNEMMASAVERRHGVKFMQQKANQLKVKAQALKNPELSGLMEIAAKAMVSGHMTAIYAMLKKIRRDMQENIHAVKRQQKRREKRYTTKAAKLRSWQIRLHRRINRKVETVLRHKSKINKAEEKAIHCHVSMENSRLAVLFAKRDKAVLGMRCHRQNAAYPKRRSSWLSELKSLKIFTSKLSGYYQKTAAKTSAKKQ